MIQTKPIKIDIKKINNKEILDTSNNQGHSFMTFIVENYDPFSSFKSFQIKSDAPLLQYDGLP